MPELKAKFKGYGDKISSAMDVATPFLSPIGDMVSSAMNIGQANKQMRFQERMSNTQHQREMADLRKAGLNPILDRGNGAGVPSGAMATITNPAKDLNSAQIQRKLSRATLSKTALELKVLETQEALNSALEQKASNEASVANEQWQTMARNRKLTHNQMKAMSDYYGSKWGKWSPYIESGLNSARGLAMPFGLGLATSSINRAMKTRNFKPPHGVTFPRR